MLDILLSKKLFEAARREGLDLNDEQVQAKLIERKAQIEGLLINVIEQQTKYCGCGNKTPGERLGEDNN